MGRGDHQSEDDAEGNKPSFESLDPTQLLPIDFTLLRYFSDFSASKKTKKESDDFE